MRRNVNRNVYNAEKCKRYNGRTCDEEGNSYIPASACWIIAIRGARKGYHKRSHFMKGEHVMHHSAGLWNGIWSDMIIETIFMRYGHAPDGIVGITLKPETLKVWPLVCLHAAGWNLIWMT